MGLSRALDLIQQGAEPTADELDALAASLNVLPREIEVSEAMHHREEIVITRRSTGDSSSDSLAATASNDSEKEEEEEPWVKSEEPRLFPEDATAAKDAGCQAYIPTGATWTSGDYLWRLHIRPPLPLSIPIYITPHGTLQARFGAESGRRRVGQPQAFPRRRDFLGG